MGIPSPFEIGGRIGGNLSGAFQQQRDISAIDEILSKAESEKDSDQIIGTLLGRVSPEKQGLALELLAKKKAAINEKKNQAFQENIASQIEQSYPNSSMHKIVASIYRSKLPLEQKEKMIKNISQQFPYKAEQQERLRLDSTLKRYNSRIKEEQTALQNAKYDERAAINERIKALQKERDELLDFQALIEKPEKPKFDKANPEHQARARELQKKGKTKEEIRKELSKEFEF